MVTVMDNGVGMTDEEKVRMYDPWFTTKADRLGIGLTTTRALVEKYGGALSVRSHVGGGTVARIELPGMSGT